MDLPQLQFNFESKETGTGGLILHVLEGTLATLHANVYHILFPVLLTIIVIYLWDIYVKGNCDRKSPLPLPPGNSGWPIIGETLPFLINGRTYFRSRLGKYGPIYRTHIIGLPTIVICDSRNINDIFNCENDILVNCTPPTARKLFGDGTLCNTVKPDEHKTKHKLVRGVFKQNNLENYTLTMQRIMHSCIDVWLEKTKLNGVKEIQRMALLVSCSSFLGLDLGQEYTERLMNLFGIYRDNFFSFPIDLPGTGFRKAMHARKEILKIISKNLVTGNISENSALNILMNNNYIAKDKTDDDKTTETLNLALEILFGGQTTVASACCSIMLYLALNRDVLLNIRKEIDSIYGEASTGFISYQDITHMNYTKHVVKEVLRLTPPIAGGFRKAIKPFELQGFQIPKDWGILYCITDTHERATSFAKSSPLTFNPERWNKVQNKGQIPDNNNNEETNETPNEPLKYEYIPFGGGSRPCPGKEYALLFLRVFTVVICRSCDWKLDNGMTMPSIKTDPIPFPSDGMPITVSKID